MSRHHAAGGRVPRRLAQAILRESDVCWLCGRPGSTTIDHLVPLARGGSSTPANLVPAHLDCNSARGTNTIHPPARIARPGPPRWVILCPECGGSERGYRSPHRRDCPLRLQ